jgi:hypothetical protein
MGPWNKNFNINMQIFSLFLYNLSWVSLTQLEKCILKARIKNLMKENTFTFSK